jgi:hypothetical protein
VCLTPILLIACIHTKPDVHLVKVLSGIVQHAPSRYAKAADAAMTPTESDVDVESDDDGNIRFEFGDASTHHTRAYCGVTVCACAMTLCVQH